MVEFTFHNGDVPPPGEGKSPQSCENRSALHISGSQRSDGKKEKRQPSITPRKFNRFFTPRSNERLITSPSRTTLQDITAPTNNRDGTQSSPIWPLSNAIGIENSPTAFTREMKRRKLSHSPSLSPEETDPAKRCLFDQRQVSDDRALEDQCPLNSSQLSVTTEDTIGSQNLEISGRTQTRQIKQLDARGLAGRLLQLNLKSNTTSKYQRLKYSTNDWQDHTTEFYSCRDDIHNCTSIKNSTFRSIPFCATSCNTNSLVAIGDEEGYIRLLESAKNGKPPLQDVFLAFQPHSNAVIDMCFSLDDSLLATASGDQTARLVDMTTQRTISILAQHSASLKQVKFQPGAANNSVIATSSRDGSIQIWDLRCRGSRGPVQDLHIPLDPMSITTARAGEGETTYGCVVNSIYDAHRPGLHGRSPQSAIARDGPSRGERPGRLGDVSITAIAFLPEGQEHMLLTASEANASVKLWDLRFLHHTRRKAALPLSCTALPESHNQWRHFGINSLSLSGNGNRLYALCRDNTVYAYSTAHLILGQAPELSTNTSYRRQHQGDIREGLGPLYGFRHQQLRATSFYIKATIRAETAGKVEMLAVGSSDGCTILFPTDERYIGTCEESSEPGPTTLPYPRRTKSIIDTRPRFRDNIPISEKGTPLIRGHDTEVSALNWTSEGELITVGDDCRVRCWREGPMARKLRTGGEAEGQRWLCGWADAPDCYDQYDEDDN